MKRYRRAENYHLTLWSGLGGEVRLVSKYEVNLK